MQPGSPDARRGSLASGCCCVTHTASIRYRWSAYLDLQLVRAMLGLAHRSTVQRRIPPRTGVVMGLRGEVLTRCGVRRLRRYVALHPWSTSARIPRWRHTWSTNAVSHEHSGSFVRASTFSTATGETSSRTPKTRTPFSRHIPGANTANGTSD